MEKGREWKEAGQGNRQDTEVSRARNQAECRGNRQGKETGRARQVKENNFI